MIEGENKVKFIEYTDRWKYAEAEKQMHAYPEAYAIGHIIFKRRENRRIVTYCMKTAIGEVISSSFPFSALKGITATDQLRYLWELK